MKSFIKMDIMKNNYNINKTKKFFPLGSLDSTMVEKVFQFAYNMTFSDKGEHRDHRSGGTHIRKKGEIFANAFQGKLAECAVYVQLSQKMQISTPDFETYGLGKWDMTDFFINDYKVSIKSTKSYGNLLLLETKDWDIEARYLPNNDTYDFTFLVRMFPYCEDILKKSRLLYSNYANIDELKEIICSQNWKYDIPGFITSEELQYIIKNKYIIPKNGLLNGNTKMDAENYYVQAGDMHSLDEFIEMISCKNLK